MKHGIRMALLLTIALGFSAPRPSAGAISWYDYDVRCTTTISASYNLKETDCGGDCVEGHDCSNCSGWEVRRPWTNPGLLQAGTKDKTYCCRFDSSCGTDPKYYCCPVFLGLECGSNLCPANNCPGTIFSKTVTAVHADRLQCTPGPTSSFIPTQRLAVGSRHDNSPSCGSHCDNSDDFTGYGFGYGFGYTVAWTCDGQDHSAGECTITANSACGNGICELIGNEHFINCPEDCEGCTGEDPDCEE